MRNSVLVRCLMLVVLLTLGGCAEDACTDGHKLCNQDGTLSVCEAGEWSAGEACDAGQMCHAMGGGSDHCMPSAMLCESGQTQCIDGKLSTCTNDMWTPGVACPEGQVCQDVDGIADVCAETTE